MIVCETARLRIRHLDAAADAAFILGLLNEPSFIQNIADRGVRTLEDANRYITTGPLASYAKFGYGLFMAELRDGTPIGMCGLVNRDWLGDVDVGFAYLPQFWSKGYAFEAASAVMAWGRETKGLARIVGITASHNVGSMRVLEKLGLKFARVVRSPENVESLLYLPDSQPPGD